MARLPAAPSSRVHGPYLHGNGWAAVNQFPVGAGNAPLLQRQPVGPAEEGAFSLSPTLSRAHWGIHGG
ncbi:hypothetical protein T492DRAFT_864699 [Pavlovales sp. CCMP2436]|nr:hypothetical protein T492DRAFT_864699 [Pavlovales sp. CCMP2436]